MDVNELVQMVFSGLSPLVMEDMADEGERIVVRARTPLDTAVCQVCGASSGRVHGYHWRTVADVPVDGRRVVVRVRVRRLVCPTRGCRHTFREQVPGVLERYQRRTARLTRQVKAVVLGVARLVDPVGLQRALGREREVVDIGRAALRTTGAACRAAGAALGASVAVGVLMSGLPPQ